MAEIKNSFFYRFAIKHIQPSLINEQRHISLAQILSGPTQRFQWPIGYADIKCFPLTNDIDKRLQRFLYRRIWIETMGIKQIHIIQMHTF